jgi:hypothetical protein
LVVIGRSIWFTADEWDFVAGRTAWDLGDLFRSHNEHWSTLPIIVYRLLWWVFGLRTHLPHVVIAVVLHLTVAALLRVVMRQAGVSPWVATIVASVYALFGYGYLNAEYAFQMAWGMALALGLGYLILVQHDGPFDGRDAIGLTLGIGSVMSAGPGVVMVVVAVLAAFVRRGWRVATVHALTLTTIFMVWWAVIGRKGYLRHASPNEAVHFMLRHLWVTFRALGNGAGVGIVLIVLLVTGIALTLREWHGSDPRRRPVSPLSMLAGVPLFLFITGTGRGAPGTGFISGLSTVSRYIDVAAVLLLPALAVAADQFARRSRWYLLATALVLLVGVPGNVAQFHRGADGLATQSAFDRWFVPAAAYDPVATEVPRDLQLNILDDRALTIGWLLDSTASGRVPHPPRLTASMRANEALALALHRTFTSPPMACRPLQGPVMHVLQKGDFVRVGAGRVDVVYVASDGSQSPPLHLGPSSLKAFAGPLPLRLVPIGAPARTPVVCL